MRSWPPPVNGVRELIEHARNGFLIEPDPDVIATHLRELAADPELRARLGGAAREAALEFSAARMVDRHSELYTQLAATLAEAS